MPNFLSCLKKKSLWWDFLIMPLRLSSHFNVAKIVVPRNLKHWTFPMSWPLIVNGKTTFVLHSFYFSLKTKPSCASSAARTFAPSINQAVLKRLRWKRLSSRDQWNLTPAVMCRGRQRALCVADALEQRRLCTWNHVKFLLAQFQENGRSLEPCHKDSF